MFCFWDRREKFQKLIKSLKSTRKQRSCANLFQLVLLNFRELALSYFRFMQLHNAIKCNAIIFTRCCSSFWASDWRVLHRRKLFYRFRFHKVCCVFFYDFMDNCRQQIISFITFLSRELSTVNWVLHRDSWTSFAFPLKLNATTHRFSSLNSHESFATFKFRVNCGFQLINTRVGCWWCIMCRTIAIKISAFLVHAWTRKTSKIE